MVTELTGWCLELGLRRKSTFYIGRPVFYTGGLVLALSTMMAGGTVIVDDYGKNDDNDEVWALLSTSVRTGPRGLGILRSRSSASICGQSAQSRRNTEAGRCRFGYGGLQSVDQRRSVPQRRLGAR